MIVSSAKLLNIVAYFKLIFALFSCHVYKVNNFINYFIQLVFKQFSNFSRFVIFGKDIFEVIRENLPFFIGGMVAGTFGLSITDDSSPLKGWVEDRRKSSMSSLSQNINKLVDPPSPSAIRIRQEEEAVFTVPTTKTTLENNNNDNISSTE